MKSNLIVFGVMAAIVAYAAWANAEAPAEPCARAEYLAAEVEDGLALIDELIEMARPVCAERALARDCARQRIEIRARIAEVRQTQALQTLAARKCKSGTTTRRASSNVQSKHVG